MHGNGTCRIIYDIKKKVMIPRQPPISRQPKKLPVHRCRLTTLISTEQPNTSPETCSTLTTSVHTDTISINVHQACINNDQESRGFRNQPSESIGKPVWLSPHTPAQQPRSEAVTHPLQPPVTDIKPNISRDDCSNNELAAKCLHIPNDRRRNWPIVSTE